MVEVYPEYSTSIRIEESLPFRKRKESHVEYTREKGSGKNRVGERKGEREREK
jgi:hypothetical protein